MMACLMGVVVGALSLAVDATWATAVKDAIVVSITAQTAQDINRHLTVAGCIGSSPLATSRSRAAGRLPESRHDALEDEMFAFASSKRDLNLRSMTD
jgi:hypothetical protein